jgi:hypothetical protein
VGSVTNKRAINICIYGSNVLKELALLPSRPRTAHSNSTVANFLTVLSYRITKFYNPLSKYSQSQLIEITFCPATILADNIVYLPPWDVIFSAFLSTFLALIYSRTQFFAFFLSHAFPHIYRIQVNLVHAVEAYRGNRDIAPLVLNLGTRWRKQLIARPGRLSAVNHWAEWTPSAVWTASRTEKSLAPTRNQTTFLGCPVI